MRSGKYKRRKKMKKKEKWKQILERKINRGTTVLAQK